MSARFIWSRRRFMGGVAAVAAWELWMHKPGAFAEELTRTPEQTEGPFYPDKLPLDTDNDLLIVNDTITPAVGEITHLTGRILDAGGNPVRNALVEIWQVDGKGIYLHTGDSGPRQQGSGRRQRDTNFQGFGRFLTSKDGEYYFRTLKPVTYPGRTPHIHFKVKKGERELLCTQCYIEGHPDNERDGIYRHVGDENARRAVTVAFAPIEDSKIGELAANFDIVLGLTPEM